MVGLALKIAWRNLLRHKGKSLVIGLILFIGSVLMTVGNGLISGMENGLSANIVNLFTGDLVALSTAQEKDDVLFDMEGKPLKVIKEYRKVKRVLESERQLEAYLPVAAGMVFVFNSGSDMGYIMLLGVEIERYRKFFPRSFMITEGRMLKSGERGVLISEEARKMAFDSMDFWLVPEGARLIPSKLPADARVNLTELEVRRDLVFMGASEANTTVDIRLPVTGVITYKSLNKIWGYYAIVDIESFREAHNYVTGSDAQDKITENERKLLESDQLDQLFSSEKIVSDTTVTAGRISVDGIRAQTAKNQSTYNVDAGSYNLIFLKVKPGQSPQKLQRKLNGLFKAEGLPARVVSWKDAVGAIGSMAIMIKGALNMFIIFIFFVAIIVIMNTLSMAALERTSEIAMMRAVGARKGFLRKMFVVETATLSFLFGGLGILCGAGVILALSAAKLTTTNELWQLVYGGDRLNPLFTLPDLIFSLLELGVVTFLAVLYPLRIVGKIAPLDAIARE